MVKHDHVLYVRYYGYGKDIVFRSYTRKTHYEHIIKESQQRTTTALPLHYNYVWVPLPTVTKASEGLLSQ